MKRLIIIIGIILPYLPTQAQTDFILPIKGHSLYYLLDQQTLLELDTLSEIYTLSIHADDDIFIEENYFRIEGNKIVYETNENSIFMDEDYIPKYINNYELYFKERDIKKDKNSISCTAKENIALEHDFDAIYEVEMSKYIMLSKRKLDKLKEKGQKFKTAFLTKVDSISPNYTKLLNKQYIGPEQLKHYYGDERVRWEFSTTDSALMQFYEVIIHESIHKVNNVSEAKFKLVVTPTEIIEINKSKVVETSTMDYFFSERCNTDKLFRDNYFSKNSGSSIYGIYGLMDEFSAYYNAMVVSYQGYNYYLNKDSVIADEFKKCILSNAFAYYEFNLFIGGYLAYCKQYTNQIYFDLINNAALCEAYTKINKQYQLLVNKAEDEFGNSDLWEEICDTHLSSIQNDLPQFLLELEVLKNNFVAKN